MGRNTTANDGCYSPRTGAIRPKGGVGTHWFVTSTLLLPAGRGSPVTALAGLRGEPYLPKPEVLRLAGMVDGGRGGEVLRPDEDSRCSARSDFRVLPWPGLACCAIGHMLARLAGEGRHSTTELRTPVTAHQLHTLASGLLLRRVTGAHVVACCTKPRYSFARFFLHLLSVFVALVRAGKQTRGNVI